jgi:hypothetical protein
MAVGSAQPSRTLLITPQYLIDNSPVNSNVEQKLLASSIRKAEDIYLMPLIGSELYQAIIGKISGGTMAAGVYKDLLDLYIAPALVEYSVIVYIPFTSIKLRNKGTQKQLGDNSEPANLEDLAYLTTSVRDSAQFYAERLIKYLKQNMTQFPEYLRYSTIDSILPANNDYFSGLQFTIGPNQRTGGQCWDGDRYKDINY